MTADRAAEPDAAQPSETPDVPTPTPAEAAAAPETDDAKTESAPSEPEASAAPSPIDLTPAEPTEALPETAPPSRPPEPPAPVEDPRIAELAKQITELAQELDTLRAQRGDLTEKLLRTAADFDNYRKRSRRELEEAKLRGRDETIRELLPVFDNLERATAAAGNSQESSAVLEGVRMVLKLFEDTAQRMGLVRVPSVGARFDPAVHEALQQRETDEAPPGTVLTEVTPGYTFGKRLLRAALVIVAREPTQPKASPSSETIRAEPLPAEVPEAGDPESTSQRPAAPPDAAVESQTSVPADVPADMPAEASSTNAGTSAQVPPDAAPADDSTSDADREDDAPSPGGESP